MAEALSRADPAGETVLLLDNADVARLLTMPDTMAALRVVYEEFARGDATYVPRIDVFAPTGRPEDFYQWGSMSGVSLTFGVLALRMKSDVVSWPHGQRQEKWAGRPGLFCGLVMAFDVSTGAPLAIIQDGFLQHLRVGAAAGIGTDVLARGDARSLGLLGSGGMAEAYLDAIAAIRDLDRISVYSPDARHRADFAERAATRLGKPVTAVGSAEEAVRGHDIVATATSSMGPTFDAGWLEAGAHVTCVTRRELSTALVERADHIVQLGLESVPRDATVPMMEWKAGGMAAYVCGPPAQRARIPVGSAAEAGVYPTLADVQAGRAPGRQSADDVTLFVNVGAQGLQFAAVAGLLVRSARAAGAGKSLPASWLLGDIRD
jgi:ornithine cyclodeaminase/alanine dehydrogenase-like protein (mu-crystallin family)